jgi:hypothetical protein
VLHYINPANALRNRFSFDAARPTALLYRPVPGGEPELLGVMYTMPSSTSLDDLDASVPLGLTSWHQHINTCRPRGLRKDDVTAFLEARAMRHVTQEACGAAGGRFVAEPRNWMVHVNVMAERESEVWEHRGHSARAGAGAGEHMH